jgi:hypothetical protein
MDTSNTQAVSANFRLRYNYRPDSNLYIIYNVGTQFARIAPANPPQVWETRLAVKWTYSFRPMNLPEQERGVENARRKMLKLLALFAPSRSPELLRRNAETEMETVQRILDGNQGQAVWSGNWICLNSHKLEFVTEGRKARDNELT